MAVPELEEYTKLKIRQTNPDSQDLQYYFLENKDKKQNINDKTKKKYGM